MTRNDDSSIPPHEQAGSQLTQELLGDRIARARARAHVPQRELAEDVGLTQSAISRIEAGERSVDSLELARIAGRLGVSAVDLLERDPIAEQLHIAARAEGFDHHAEDEPILRRILDYVRLSRLVTSRQAPSPQELDLAPPAHGNPVTEGRWIAKTVREKWGLGDDPLPTSMYSLIEERSDLSVALEPMAEHIAGLFACLDDFSLALINSSAPYGRQRFTVAHELCHYLMGDGKTILIDRDIFRGQSHEERRANAFAAHFLMPEESIERYLRNRSDVDGEVAVELQYTFGVSLDAMLWHLVSLEIISRERREELMSIGAKALAIRYGFGSEWHQFGAERDQRRPPRPLQERALRAYEHAEIGIEPLAELMGRRDIPALRRDLEDQGISYDDRWWEESAPV